MLRRNHDLGGFHRHAVFVAHGHLAFRIRPKLWLAAGFARVRHQAENFVRIENRRRHQFRRLAAGIAEHDALIARAFILVAARIHALGNVRRLRVQQNFDVGSFPVETILLIADVADGSPGHILDHGKGDLLRPAGFARDHHAVGGGQRFACHAQIFRLEAVLRTFAEEEIHHLVRNAVADLVGMAFGHAFTGEKIVPVHAQRLVF